MSTLSLDAVLTVPFTFRARPTSLPADLRPSRRVALLLLILSRCRGDRATLEQLHVLDWACRSKESRQLFTGCISRGRPPDVPCVRVDPSLNRAVDWATGDRLVATTASVASELRGETAHLNEYRVWLLNRGHETVRMMEKMPDFLSLERDLLESVGRTITQDFIRPFLRWQLRE
jgi:hypothetical protein